MKLEKNAFFRVSFLYIPVFYQVSFLLWILSTLHSDNIWDIIILIYSYIFYIRYINLRLSRTENFRIFCNKNKRYKLNIYKLYLYVYL